MFGKRYVNDLIRRSAENAADKPIEAPPTPPGPKAPANNGAKTAAGRAGGKAAAGKGGGDPAAARGGGSYDRLVADADRLMSRGQAIKAEKLYEQALAARPDGVAAITGQAYVLLDQQRHFRAIDTFRHALDLAPSYGPALFGIAESYRARGDKTQALSAYRQYLSVSPGGADAPAARRQIKDLESGGNPAESGEHAAAKSSDDEER